MLESCHGQNASDETSIPAGIAWSVRDKRKPRDSRRTYPKSMPPNDATAVSRYARRWATMSCHIPAALVDDDEEDMMRRGVVSQARPEHGDEDEDDGLVMCLSSSRRASLYNKLQAGECITAWHNLFVVGAPVDRPGGGPSPHRTPDRLSACPVLPQAKQPQTTSGCPLWGPVDLDLGKIPPNCTRGREGVPGRDRGPVHCATSTASSSTHNPT